MDSEKTAQPSSQSGNKSAVRLFTSLLVLFACLVSPIIGSADTPSVRDRIEGQMPSVVKNLQPTGRLSSTNRLRLSIHLALRHPDALTNFLSQLYAPGSAGYRHYLTPDEFDSRFGPTEEDYEAVAAWAVRNGFDIAARHPNRLWLEASAPASVVEAALNVTLRTYQHPAENRVFFAPDSEPSLDSGLRVLSIAGLDNYARPHPMSFSRPLTLTDSQGPSPRAIGSGPNGNLAGNDFRAAYAPGVALKGSGQTVGLLEFDGYYPSDITSYNKSNSIPNIPLQNILLDGFDGTPGAANDEVALDIDMVACMAPGLQAIVVYEAGPNGNQNDILAAMSTNTAINQFSCSWGFGTLSTADQATMDNYFMKMDAQGQTFLNAVGDNGAFSGPVDPPADDPYITQVGGTALGTAGPESPWLSEIVWNSQEGTGAYTSGSGGISTTYPIPSWQQGVNMSANGGSTTFRNSPDVAAAADNIFLVADDGQLVTIVGTSAAAPLWAGFIALANQAATTAGLPSVGFINPAIYNIGASSGYSAAFDDITVGNNYSGTPGQFYASPGYDLCTGWGSPIGGPLIIALAQPDGFIITPGRGPVASGSTGGPFSAATQIFSFANTGSSSLSWSLGTATSWLTVSDTQGSLPPGGSGAITVTLNSAADLLAAGVYTGQLWITNLTSGLAQLRQFTLQVDQNLILDGGFEAGNFSYWVLAGNSKIYNDNYATATFKPGRSGSSYSPHSGLYFAYLAQSGSLAYLDQPIPTKPGQRYLLSFWLENPVASTPNEFKIQWDTNSAAPIFDQTDMKPFTWTNYQFTVQATSALTTLQFGSRNDRSFFGLDDVTLTPLPPLTVASPMLSANILITPANPPAIQFSWPAVVGAVYQIQYNDNLLSPGSWLSFGSPITATSTNITISTPTTLGAVQFYRLLLVQ